MTTSPTMQDAAAEGLGWQPIETAPKDGTAIWVLLDGQPYIGYCQPADDVFNEPEKWFVKASFRRRPRDRRNLPDEIYGTNARGVHPFYWMPLPELPNIPKH